MAGSREGTEGRSPRLDAALPLRPALGRARLRVCPGQESQRERPEQQPEVAQGDVAVAPHEQEVDDDAPELAGHQQAAEARRDRNHEARGDLDHADQVHRVR